MDRSLGFASTAYDSIALLRLAFATTTHLKCLILPQTVTRRLIMRKARGHPFPEGHRAPTTCRYMVSGTFNSPNRGTFHLSLTLLFTIGCRVVLSLGGWTPQLHTEFHELRATLDTSSTEGFRFRVQDYHLLWFRFSSDSANVAFVTPRWSATPKSKLLGLG